MLICSLGVQGCKVARLQGCRAFTILPLAYASLFSILLHFFVQRSYSSPLGNEDRGSQTGEQGMTNEQREKITALRHEGWGYKKISAALCISANTVKSFCRKDGLGGILAVPDYLPDDDHCRKCGILLNQMVGTKKRKFCSPECRIKWWAVHPEAIKQKAVYTFTCPTCAKEFSIYGNASRKYCSHECYIANRFKIGNPT